MRDPEWDGPADGGCDPAVACPVAAAHLDLMRGLARTATHDLNNMLTAILCHADLLASDLPTDGWMASSVVEMRTAAERAAVLTRQIQAAVRQAALTCARRCAARGDTP
jgi:hypothetical protein